MNIFIIKSSLIFFLIFWTCYSYIDFCHNSRLVYSYRKDLKIKSVALEFDGSLNARDLYLLNVYNAQNNVLSDTNVVIKGYQWSKITSIHRLIFLNREKIKNAQERDKIYYYLYLNNKTLFFNNQVFGLSFNQEPSKLYLYSDYLRYATKIVLIIVLILWGIVEWIGKKYIKKIQTKFIPTPLFIGIIIILFL